MTTATATVPALVSAQGKLVWDVYGAIVLADWLTSTREAPSTTSNKETTKTWRRRGDGRSNTWASARLTSPSAPTPSYQCSRWLLAHVGPSQENFVVSCLPLAAAAAVAGLSRIVFISRCPKPESENLLPPPFLLSTSILLFAVRLSSCFRPLRLPFSLSLSMSFSIHGPLLNLHPRTGANTHVCT